MIARTVTVLAWLQPSEDEASIVTSDASLNLLIFFTKMAVTYEEVEVLREDRVLRQLCGNSYPLLQNRLKIFPLW